MSWAGSLSAVASTPQSTSMLASGTRAASTVPAPAAVSAGMVDDSTTLDLSELDPGFRTSTRIAS